MYNNASYRRYNVSGTTSFTFAEVGNTVRMAAAVTAWPGATINPIEPEPGVDGRAFIAYKVTNPSAGVWHYEYALYNENLDRAIQSFSVPLGCAITLNNPGFHAPLNHPGFPNDGTLGGAGFSNVPWNRTQTMDSVSWSSEAFGQNQNANAIRWGTLYNFRFDSNKPPVATNATIGFFKTGAPVTVPILGPNACDQAPSPTPAPSSTPTPGPAAKALNLSTRMRVLTDENVGIGGLIVTGTVPKQVLLRAIGPSLAQAGISGALADPVLELHGPKGFVTITNDDWRATQEAAITATGIPPGNDLESAIVATLDVGSYTAIVRGKNNTTGVGLIEAYDLNPAVFTRLANISTRAFVGTGGDIVIAGFILGQDPNNTTIVLRGLGPSLTQIGVANPLADPALQLRDGNGTLLMSNNNWTDDQSQSLTLILWHLQPANVNEAAMVVIPPPGLYTALLSGMNNTTGVGLVEVYELGPH
jgi:hypothetical protein